MNKTRIVSATAAVALAALLSPGLAAPAAAHHACGSRGSHTVPNFNGKTWRYSAEQEKRHANGVYGCWAHEWSRPLGGNVWKYEKKFFIKTRQAI